MRHLFENLFTDQCEHLSTDIKWHLMEWYLMGVWYENNSQTLANAVVVVGLKYNSISIFMHRITKLFCYSFSFDVGFNSD